jgi:hypothetical protein
MPTFDSRSSTAIQLIANEILKVMYYSPHPEEAFHINGTAKPDDLKNQLRWSAKRLFVELRSGRDVSLLMVGEALKMLHGENYITMCLGSPSGFELLEKGRTEAERLGAKPA